MQGCRSLPGTETWIRRTLTEFPSGADVTLGRRAHLCWDGQAASRVVEKRGRGDACGTCLSGGPFRHGGAPGAKQIVRHGSHFVVRGSRRLPRPPDCNTFELIRRLSFSTDWRAETGTEVSQ